MGVCISTHQKASAMKVQVDESFQKSDKLVIPSSPTKEKPPVINGDLDVKQLWPTSKSADSFRDFGSKEETFFDSQAWLESDDEFMSVKGDFTPSRGNTPVHHNFSVGKLQVSGGVSSMDNSKTPSPIPQPSPTPTENKMRLSDLFKESMRGTYDEEENVEPANENGIHKKADNPLGSEVNQTGNVEMTPKRERPMKSMQGCIPTLLYSCGSSTNGRKKKPSPSRSPIAV